MPSTRARQLRRDHQRIERRQAAQDADARDTQKQQAEAAARQAFALSQRHHRMAYALWTLAVAIAVGHFFEHANTIRVMSPGLEDLFIGWPMAGMLGIVGGIVYGP